MRNLIVTFESRKRLLSRMILDKLRHGRSVLYTRFVEKAPKQNRNQSSTPAKDVNRHFVFILQIKFLFEPQLSTFSLSTTFKGFIFMFEWNNSLPKWLPLVVGGVVMQKCKRSRLDESVKGTHTTNSITVIPRSITTVVKQVETVVILILWDITSENKRTITLLLHLKMLFRHSTECKCTITKGEIG